MVNAYPLLPPLFDPLVSPLRVSSDRADRRAHALPLLARDACRAHEHAGDARLAHGTRDAVRAGVFRRRPRKRAR